MNSGPWCRDRADAPNQSSSVEDAQRVVRRPTWRASLFAWAANRVVSVSAVLTPTHDGARFEPTAGEASLESKI